MLEIEVQPRLQDPLLVIAIGGWVDAGEAGSLAASTIISQLDHARHFATYRLEELIDLQQTRPTIELIDGETRNIIWPQLTMVAGKLGRDAVVITGPEPSLRWPQVISELVEMACDLGVRQAFTLGGMPAMVSHRRPLPVLATATAHSVAQEIGATRTDYTGPTGFQTALQVALGESGIPSVGLWVQVPHYVSGNASPTAVSALLERVREFGGLNLDLADLDGQVDAYLEKVEEGLQERPDVADLVRAIEAETTGEISGDALATEIERFLRDQ